MFVMSISYWIGHTVWWLALSTSFAAFALLFMNKLHPSVKARLYHIFTVIGSLLNLIAGFSLGLVQLIIQYLFYGIASLVYLLKGKHSKEQSAFIISNKDGTVSVVWDNSTSKEEKIALLTKALDQVE